MMMAQGCRSLRNLVTRSRGNVAPRFFATLPPEVVIFPDRDMVVCWHPEQNFPYECSKPLPEPEKPSPAVLKIQEKEVRATFARKPGQKTVALELASLTYTCMHRWFPRSRDKKAKKTKPDRPYL